MDTSRNNTTRVYLENNIRKYLGLDLKHTKVYVFNFNGAIYISTNTIPTHLSYTVLAAQVGYNKMYVDIPTAYIPYPIAGYAVTNTKYPMLKLLKKEN